MINIKQIEKDTRRIYEECFELSLLEEQLEDMLTALDKNNIEFERGKLSRTAFKANESKLKKSSVSVIKNIKEIINSSTILIGNIEEEVQSQGVKRTRKKSKKLMNKIKKVTEKVAKNGSD